MKRTQYVLYAVTLREHPGIVKLGRTTSWKQRRNEYDKWNFADGDGIAMCALFCLTEEYVDLPALEAACLSAMAMQCPRYRGNEWFKGTLEQAVQAIEDVLATAQTSYSTPGFVPKPRRAVVALREVG